MSKGRVALFVYVVIMLLPLSFLLIGALGLLLLKSTCTQGLKLGVGHTHLLIVAYSKMLMTVIATCYNPVVFLKLTIPRLYEKVFHASSRHVLVPTSLLTNTSLTLMYGLVTHVPNFRNTLPMGSIATLMNTPMIVSILFGGHHGRVGRW